MTRRVWGIFSVLALAVSVLMVFGLVRAPGFTDVFYHFNAATRWASGQGLTDAYLWTYIGAGDVLPAPSHLYWMPMTSLLTGTSMALFGQAGNYAVAQIPLALCLALTACLGFWLGHRLGGQVRHAWLAGLLTLFSGFYVRFWGAVDTFAPYALFGALCLVCLALWTERRNWRYAFAAGLCAALAHLTRADGVLLLLVGWVVVVWEGAVSEEIHKEHKGTKDTKKEDQPPRRQDENARQGVRPFVIAAERTPYTASLRNIRQIIVMLAVMTLGYGLVMSGWFVRNINLIGSPLPLGGTQALWLREYDDLFHYPPNNSPATLLADGVGALLQSRWLALTQNMGTFVAVEGLIVLTPLMLLGLWRRRKQGFLRGFWLYALGVHLAMTVAFPFPGYRGGLLHSAAALVPWWAALGAVGLDEAIDWMAKRRRAWNPRTAKPFFAGVLVVYAIGLSLLIGLPNRVMPLIEPQAYADVDALLPQDARVMLNDPAQFYYFTGRGGVVLPNEAPAMILEIARRYQIDYVLIEGISEDGQSSIALPSALASVLTAPPPFLTPIPLADTSRRLYAIAR